MSLPAYFTDVGRGVHAKPVARFTHAGRVQRDGEHCGDSWGECQAALAGLGLVVVLRLRMDAPKF
jgi:hypothetical protein